MDRGRDRAIAKRFYFVTIQLSLTFEPLFEMLCFFAHAIFTSCNTPYILLLLLHAALNDNILVCVHSLPCSLEYSFCTRHVPFLSIWFVCLINVKHFQNNGYNEYKYNEWSRKCGVSVLVRA